MMCCFIGDDSVVGGNDGDDVDSGGGNDDGDIDAAGPAALDSVACSEALWGGSCERRGRHGARRLGSWRD